jgi:hypothetical protein
VGRLVAVPSKAPPTVTSKTPQRSFTYEEIETVLCDCEPVTNARSLTYVSEDSSDLTSIMPNMFLLGIKEVELPECNAADSGTLNQWARVLLED